MKHQPPRLARLMLKWFCHVEFLEEIEGDLHEQFVERVENQGLLKARLYYFRDVFKTIRPYPAMRTNKLSSATHSISLSDQLKHFLKVSLRNMQRSKSVTFINIAGLAISLTSFLLIALYVIDELTFDAFHPDAANTYRISYSYKRYGDGVDETDARVAGLWTVALKESVPEIKNYTRFSRFGYPGTVKFEDKVFVEQQFFWVDSTYTDIFSLPLLSDVDPANLLRDSQYVIINEDIAIKYFGKADPIGRSIIYMRDGMEFSLIVGAVMKRYSSNATFHPDFIASNQALNPLWKRDGADRVNSWRDTFTYSYVQLEQGADPAKIKNGLRQIFDAHLGTEAKLVRPEVVKLTDLHFTSGMKIELENPGSRSYLYIFGSIGVLILFIACINYMNLATARSLKRAKEVGLRKTLGVNKASLIIQFLGESFLTTFLAILLAVVLLVFMLPFFNEISSKRLPVESLVQVHILFLIPLVFLIVGTVSGSYPAFYLSRFKPVEVLKGRFSSGKGSENFRKILVITQFSITLLLIIGTVVIDRQLTYINDSKLGSLQSQIITVRTFGFIDMRHTQQFKHLAQQNADVSNISLGTHIPRLETFGWIDTRIKVPSLNDNSYMWQKLDVDSDFPAMFNLEFIAGRNFSIQNPADSAAIILNESAVKDLHITENNALGLILENEYTGQKRQVIGVVKDFPYSSIKKEIQPLIISGDYPNAENMYIRLEGKNYAAAIESLQKIWKQVYPSAPFQHWFMDEEFGRLYADEIRTGTIFKYFAGLAIFIGCLGLFGLASFTAEQKRKEIGIRKVLGASALQILLLLSSRFLKLIVISFFIGIPLAYFTMNNWLEDFAYRAEIGWIVFLGAGAFILVITCVTIGIESLRAAIANPVDSIRHE
jgi:putative ABC transport system permease protein